jgi:phosphinothricin acetyltransferase
VSGAPVVRPAREADAATICRIHNEGIADRIATLETRPREVGEVLERLRDGQATLVAVDGEDVLGWAAVLPYSDRCAYAGVGEYTVYVARDARGRGVGARLLDALVEHATALGRHKLVGRILTTNTASIALAHRAGFREVGVHRAHGRLDGEWRDVLVVERLLGDAA